MFPSVKTIEFPAYPAALYCTIHLEEATRVVRRNETTPRELGQNTAICKINQVPLQADLPHSPPPTLVNPQIVSVDP